MIHPVTPQRSESPAPIADSLDQRPSGVDAPGPISWDLPATAPVALPDEAEPEPVGVELAGRGAIEAPAAPPPVEVDDSDLPQPVPMGEFVADPEVDQSTSIGRLAHTVFSLGPVGRRRRPGLVATLAIVTLGISPILWVRRVNREVVDFDPRMVARPGRSALAIAVPTLLTFSAALVETARLALPHLGVSVDVPISETLTLGALGLPAMVPPLLLLVPFSAVAMVMTLERVRVIEDRAGIDPDLQLRPVASVAWLLLPLVGAGLVLARVQRRLNSVWSIAA